MLLSFLSAGDEAESSETSRAVRDKGVSAGVMERREGWGYLEGRGLLGVSGNTPQCVRRHFHPRPLRHSRINNLGDFEYLRGLKVFILHQRGPCVLNG